VTFNPEHGPECTGNHNTGLWKTLCPVSKQEANDWRKKRLRTDYVRQRPFAGDGERSGTVHGMTADEYREYIARPCYICGGVSSGIDHNHDICPRIGHSCDRCRRGPVCVKCNAVLREEATPGTLELRADKLEQDAYRLRLCAKVLQQ